MATSVTQQLYNSFSLLRDHGQQVATLYNTSLLPLANKVENTDCGQLPPKCSFPWGNLSLHLIHGCLGPPKSKKPQTASRSVQPFCSDHACDQQTHPFNSPFSGTTRGSRHQKGKTNLDLTEARDYEWQWHQMGRMQVCTSLQIDSHARTPPLSFLQAGCPSCRPTNSVKALKVLQ